MNLILAVLISLSASAQIAKKAMPPKTAAPRSAAAAQTKATTPPAKSTAPQPVHATSPAPATPQLPGGPNEGAIAVSAMIGTSGILNGKYWFSKNDSADIGVEFIDHPWTVFYGNYAYSIPELFAHSGFWGDVHLYFGAGAGVGFWDRTDHCGRWKCTWKATSTGSGNGFFLRAATGLEWFPKRRRYSAFVEAAGSWMWYPTNGSKIDGYLGGRFFF